MYPAVERCSASLASHSCTIYLYAAVKLRNGMPLKGVTQRCWTKLICWLPN